MSGHGGAPVRRPRRSLEHRMHPFARRDRDAEPEPEPEAPRGFWATLQAAFSANPPRPRQPRPEYSVPPADEETSADDASEDSDSDSDVDASEIVSSDGGSGPDSLDDDGWDEGDSRGDSGSDDGENEEALHELLDAAMDSETGDEGASEDEDEGGDESEGEGESDNESEDERGAGRSAGPALGRPEPDPRSLTDYMRRMEDDAEPPERREEYARRARRLYDAQLRAGAGAEEPVPRRLRDGDGAPGLRDAPLPAPAVVEDDPNAPYADWPGRMPDTVFWPFYLETALTVEGTRLEEWMELYDNDRSWADAEVRPLEASADGGGPAAFPDPRTLDLMLRDVYDMHAESEKLAWDRIGVPHQQPIFSWSVRAPASSPGGMYVVGPGEALGVWRRGIRQAIALHHALCIAPLAGAVDAGHMHHAFALAFLFDAAQRVARNCHRAAVNGAAPAAAEDAPDAVAYRRASLLRALPPRAAGALAATRYTPSARGPRAAVFRGFFGALIYWPALRVALRSSASTVATRYMGATMHTSETYLLARAHAKNPRFTEPERASLAAYLTLETLILERAAQWLYVATAHMLSASPTLSSFNMVRATVPLTHLPLGCVELSDAEHAVFRHEPVRAAHEREALAHALCEEYAAMRASLTVMMDLFASATATNPEVAAGVLAGVCLAVQRLAGHVNLLFCGLAGSAIYGGQRCEIWGHTLARYAALADALAPLVRNIPLAEFWEARDAAMRDLRITPMPGAPVAGKRKVVVFLQFSDGFEDIAPPQTFGRLNCLGPPVDFAATLNGYPHLVRDASRTPGPGRGSRSAAGAVPRARRARRP
ncbi:tegument protein VP13/14-1 [Beluga whale alphaherpesvirus 1]|uniref:Tegument protein UL47 n=1 Tax=Beluga whale alphaherpesvirus 1 TaxID=1434720 RepID=A0A286RUG4_9ALPH|nr:tegument protein VP13/14-1 [Beluga whale alphaherpesvirus 1]ASW27059.1 tegument protein VP13/14-1 [Beluga whale alphaherpesvirus 1]